MAGPDDERFEELLAQYLDPPAEPNPELLGVRVVWVEGDERLGALHIERKHRVSKREVEEVLFEIPPRVEAKRHPAHPGRTLFWGATRHDRWLFVVCEDREVRGTGGGGARTLKPITAFEPDEGEDYWRSP